MHGGHHHGSPGAEVDPKLSDGDSWDEKYAASTALWSGNPNPQLIAHASELTPGAALDVGCGEGADAIWLAENGWNVVAVDFSRVALERGAKRAAEFGDEVSKRIEWENHDLRQWAPGDGRFDLVSAQFMHLPEEQLAALFARVAAAVTPRGTLLIVGHHPSDLDPSEPPPWGNMYFTGSDITALLDPSDWEVQVSAAMPRTVNDPDGHPRTIHDAVFRAVRRS